MLSKNVYENAIKGFGLNEKEISMYLACLELGPSSAPVIARKAGLKRTTVYSILDRLVAVGVINQISKGKQKQFSPTAPENLVDILDSRKEKLTRALPYLQELFSKQARRPSIFFFERKESLKQIYDDVLKCKSKKVCQVVKTKAHEEIMGGTFIKEYIRKRVKAGITAYDLHPKSGEIYTAERGQASAALKRQVRYLPPQIFHAAIIMIYDNKVSMISSSKESFGFIIESNDFSQTLQGYFDFMWGLGSTEPEL